MKISDLKTGDVFSFSKHGSFHMVTRVSTSHIEYKSYNDGKIRVAYLKRGGLVFLRLDKSGLFELKWFVELI